MRLKLIICFNFFSSRFLTKARGKYHSGLQAEPGWLGGRSVGREQYSLQQTEHAQQQAVCLCVEQRLGMGRREASLHLG